MFFSGVSRFFRYLAAVFWLFSIMPVIRALGDVLLPRPCVVCGRPLRVHEECMCVRCAMDLPLTWNWNMSHHPMADRLNALIQERLMAETPEESAAHEPYAFAAALFYYRSGSGYSQLTRRLKYRADFPTGRFMARLLGERLAASPLYADVDAVVPVPLHWMRRAVRGYNQASVIGKEVADCLGVPMINLLARERKTSTQTHLDASHRLANVLGAFSLRPAALRSGAVRDAAFLSAASRQIGPDGPLHLLLIDDVFTTGSTLAACHAALREVFPPQVLRISAATLGCVQ